MMKSFLLAGLTMAALSSASIAADLESEPVDVWSGYYVGLQGGYASGDADYVEIIDGLTTTDGPYDIEGAFGGLYYGRNWQSGNFVFGLDGSISFASIEGERTGGPDSFESEIDAFSATRLRAGYSFGNILLFAAGGFSLAHVDADFDDSGTVLSDDAWLKGFTVGAGVEAKLADNWSARIEYMYIDYGEEEFEVAGASADVDFEDIHAVRAGIAYNF
jgi:outer membrane immunogenic protein